MYGFKAKSRKKIIIFAVAAIILLFAATQIRAAVNIYALKENREKTGNSSLGTAVSDTRIRVQPQPFSPTVSKELNQGDKIEILSSGKEWSKVLFYTDASVKTGYVKSSALTDLTPALIPISKIEAPESVTVPVGEKTEIEVETEPYNTNEEIKWTSGDESIAQIENGTVVPVKTGETFITASSQSCSEKISVKITENTKSIKFVSDHLTIDQNSEFSCGKYIETDGKNVDYIVSDKDCVSIKDGKIFANKEGFSVITAVSGNKTAECLLEVRGLSGNASSELKIKNAYGNYIDYHPSALYFKDGWNGYRYWLAYTPYEQNNDYWENPHIAVSNDLTHWETPPGFTNPLEPVPADYERGQCYNSDTELVFNSDTGRLECWWRYYDRPNNSVSLKRKTTADGVHWSEKEDMLVSGDMKKYDFLSPALLYENGKYRLWSINLVSNYDIEYRESTDGKNWSAIQKIKVEYENPKYNHWHLDVIHTPKGYEMDISAFLKGTNDHNVMSLYYSYSPDNVTYTKARVLLNPRRNTKNWDNKGIYRSSLLYADGKYYLFYSGINKGTGPVGIGLVSGNDVFHMQ